MPLRRLTWDRYWCVSPWGLGDTGDPYYGCETIQRRTPAHRCQLPSGSHWLGNPTLGIFLTFTGRRMWQNRMETWLQHPTYPTDWTQYLTYPERDCVSLLFNQPYKSVSSTCISISHIYSIPLSVVRNDNIYFKEKFIVILNHLQSVFGGLV